MKTLKAVALLVPVVCALSGAVSWATSKAAHADSALELAQRVERAVDRLEIAVAKLEAGR